MSSRSSRRKRQQQPAVKARTLAPTATFTGDQVTALLAATQQVVQGRAVVMPTPDQWSTSAFGPGRPLAPAPINPVNPATGRAEPRQAQFEPSWNLQINPRLHVPWHILQEAANIFLIRECIESRKAVCQLPFAVVVDPGAVEREAAATGGTKQDIESSLRDKYKGEISRCTDWLARPDKQNRLTWKKWTSLLMENRLKYDAAVVYPQYSYGGECLAWRIIDGKTIRPLLDDYGATPMPPYPAYQQVLWGFPRGEFHAESDPDGQQACAVCGARQKVPCTGQPHARTPGMPSDQLMYERTVIRSETPYGMSDVEIALQAAMLWMKRFGWMMAEYTEGVIPTTYLETDNAIDWSVTQWSDWLQALNDMLGGVTAERNKVKLFPPGTKMVQTAGIPEQYKPEYDLFLVKLLCGCLKTPASELGFTEAGALGASFHEGDEDILYRRARIPDAEWIAEIATELAQNHIGMPAALKVTVLGLESEDEAAADAVALQQVQSGRITLNDDRARLGLPPYDFEEADMPMLMGQRGVVFLEGASKASAPGVLVTPPTAGPVGPDGQPLPPGQPGQQPPGQGAAAGQKPDDDDGKPSGPPKPAAKSLPERDAVAELAAFRRWNGKGTRPFQCHSLTKADALQLAPELLNNSRILFAKAADPDPKVPARPGLAGTGTRS